MFNGYSVIFGSMTDGTRGTWVGATVSTPNQALNAILCLYRDVLQSPNEHKSSAPRERGWVDSAINLSGIE